MTLSYLAWLTQRNTGSSGLLITCGVLTKTLAYIYILYMFVVGKRLTINERCFISTKHGRFKELNKQCSTLPTLCHLTCHETHPMIQWIYGLNYVIMRLYTYSWNTCGMLRPHASYLGYTMSESQECLNNIMLRRHTASWTTCGS